MIKRWTERPKNTAFTDSVGTRKIDERVNIPPKTVSTRYRQIMSLVVLGLLRSEKSDTERFRPFFQYVRSLCLVDNPCVRSLFW